MNSRLNWSHLRRFRQTIQVLALAFYISLLFAALERRAAFPLADIFFRFDPLVGLAAMLASRSWIPRLVLGLVTLGLTLFFGRVWCGWLCPLGTLLEWVRFPAASRPAVGSGLSRAMTLSPHWRKVKNALLLLILAAAIFGNLSLLILDPLTLLTRSMTTAIIPAFNYVITSVERLLYDLPFLRPAVDWIESGLRGPLLPVKQPVFAQNALIAGLFIGILALNAFADRFWCRYLCPLGALLGLLSKISLLRPVIGPACNRCAQCMSVCRLDAIDTHHGYDIIPTECTVCLDCLVACPESIALRRAPGGIGFQWHWQPAPLRHTDPTRRRALAALTAGAAGVVILRTGVEAQQPHSFLVRPPGAQDERTFLAHCVRCSQCMKVCPTSGLQPVLFQAGLEGLWTPTLVPRLGYCDYGCNACGQVCPSGAIPPLDLASKRETVIGLAAIDRNRCWPWAQGVPCIVCEEMCPTPEKAVRLEEAEAANSHGEIVVVQHPYVLEDLCIGCGICETQCPVGGEAAIRVYRTI